MSSPLTDRQRTALDAYQQLMAQRPELFGGRPLRPIVRDRAAWERYATTHGTLLGLVAETRYSLFIVDLVESRTADGVRQHPYERVVSRAQLDGGISVVVVGTIQNPALGTIGDVVMVEQERHALGSMEIEVPRGFGEPGLSGSANALRELAEETGYLGDEAAFLGATLPNSGLSNDTVSFYHVPVLGQMASQAEAGEAIGRSLLMPPSQVWDAIREGRIRDGFTVQALGLYGVWSES